MGKSLNGKELGVGFSQRKDGYYSYRYTDYYGNRDEIYDTNISRLKVEAKRIKERNDMLKVKSKKIKISDWYKIWYDYKKTTRIKKNTLKSYNIRFVKHALPLIGRLDINDISFLDLDKCIKRIQKESGYTNAYQVKIVFKGMFDLAIKSNIVTYNIARDIELVKPLKDVKEPLSFMDEELLLSYCENDNMITFFRILIETGLRIGELLGLTLEHIDMDNRQIYVYKQLELFANDEDGKRTDWDLTETKNSSKRVVPMTDEAYNSILKAMAIRNVKKDINKKFKDILFVNNQGDIMLRSYVYYHLNKLLDTVNANSVRLRGMHITPHTFRHTFATRCFEAGMLPNTVQALLGHSEPDITMKIYIHVSNAKLKIDMASLNNYSEENRIGVKLAYNSKNRIESIPRIN